MGIFFSKPAPPVTMTPPNMPKGKYKTPTVEQGPLPSINPIPRLARVRGIGPSSQVLGTNLKFQQQLDIRGPPKSLRKNNTRKHPTKYMINPKSVEAQDFTRLNPKMNRLLVLE